MMRYFIYSLCFLIVSCTGVQNRADDAQALQSQHGYTSKIYRTQNFPLYSARPHWFSYGQDVISVVIEGDGYAWVSRSQVSGDPTPKNPVGLHIAMQAPSPALYLARPCQYVRSQRCTARYWSTDRFAPDILQSYDEALSQIKNRYGTPQTQFHLIGFSGGAYVALNMAATRNDIRAVTSIAGLIGPEDWAQHHTITPLNLATPTSTLLTKSTQTQFRHICSNADKIVPCTLTQQTIGAAPNHTITPIKDQGHEDIWTYALPLL